MVRQYRKHPPDGPSWRFWFVAGFIVMALIVVGRAYAAPSFERERTKAIIRHVFGPYGDQAVRVSSCETGGTFDIWAGWGKHQYLGLFQMGAYARARYGHGWNPWVQARAARRYFIASGRDWSPWSCRWAA